MITLGQLETIETLLKTAVISNRLNNEIYTTMHSLSNLDAEGVIERLREHQIDPVDAGHQYTQNDILRKLFKMH